MRTFELTLLSVMISDNLEELKKVAKRLNANH